MAYQSKQRTFISNGKKVKVVSRVGSENNKPKGFYVSVNGSKPKFVDNNNRAEAEAIILDRFNIKEPKKAKAKKVKVQAPKKAEKSPQAEAVQETPITNKDKFIVLADKRNSSWLTEEELKDKLFELLQKRMGDMSEFSMEQMIILRGLTGDKYQITITWAG